MTISDEMSTEEEVRWDPKNAKFVGNIDYGNIKAGETDTTETNALVMMISGFEKVMVCTVSLMKNTAAMIGDSDIDPE